MRTSSSTENDIWNSKEGHWITKQISLHEALILSSDLSGGYRLSTKYGIFMSVWIVVESWMKILWTSASKLAALYLVGRSSYLILFSWSHQTCASHPSQVCAFLWTRCRASVSGLAVRGPELNPALRPPQGWVQRDDHQLVMNRNGTACPTMRPGEFL